MGDVQVASTTDSQEAVNAAAGAAHEEAEQVPETPAEEHPQVDNEERVEPEKPKEATPKAEKYINKLTARAKSAEARATALEQELAEARKTKPVAEASTIDADSNRSDTKVLEVTDDPEPKQDDPKFKTYEDWIKATARW